MNTKQLIRSTGRWLAYGAGVGTTSYAIFAGYTWLLYGHVKPPQRPEDQDALLDRFMPVYEVVERHQVRITAPADTTFAAACEMDLQQSAIVRTIFKAREWVMFSDPTVRITETPGLIPQMRAIGWGILAEIPGREIVMGAITQPWMANPVFHSLPPEDFVRFQEPDYVKIVWTLRADPIALSESVFRTETRVVTTDDVARSKFRRYWSFISPGVKLIRWMLLGPVKAEAERRTRGMKPRSERTEIQ